MENQRIGELFRALGGGGPDRFPPTAQMVKGGCALDRIPEWERIDDLESLGRLFEGTDQVRVIPNALRQAGYGQGAVIQPQDARMFLDCGLSVWFRGLERIELFRRLREEWAADLGLPPEVLYCQLFISPAGCGTPRHFDVAHVVAMQLKGRKEWTIAPYDLERDGVPARESELMPDRGALPGERTLVLDRGDRLCMPRYWWHATRALDESWSLSLFIEPKEREA